MWLISVKRFARVFPAAPPNDDHIYVFMIRWQWFIVRHTSNNDVVIGIRWELGDLVVDRSIGTRGGDSKKTVETSYTGSWQCRQESRSGFI